MSLQILSYRDDFFPGPTDGIAWRQVLSAFGGYKISFIDDGVVKIDPSILIIFDEVGEIPLADFVHPENAQYLFGCTAMRELPATYPDVPSVRIEVPNIVHNQGLFGCQAAAIVLYDKEVKSWQ